MFAEGKKFIDLGEKHFSVWTKPVFASECHWLIFGVCPSLVSSSSVTWESCTSQCSGCQV